MSGPKEELIDEPLGIVYRGSDWIRFTWSRVARRPAFLSVRQWCVRDKADLYPSPKGIVVYANEFPTLFRAVIAAALRAFNGGVWRDDPELMRQLEKVVAA